MVSSGRNLDLLYVGTLPPHTGGSAILASMLLAELVAQGHAVRALAPITAAALENGDPVSRSRPELALTRYQVPYMESSRDTLAGDDYRRLERRRIHELLPRLIQRRRPDVVIVGRESFARHVPEVAQAHSVPAVLLVHGGRTIRRVLNGSVDADTQQVLEGFRAVHWIIAVAKHLGEDMKRVGFDNLQVIPNPVDLNLFSPGPKDEALLRELSIEPQRTIVLHVSKLASVKRPMDMVSSAERAIEKNPQLLYLIVGDGPLREAMVKACADKGLSGSFRFVGWVNHREVRDYMRLADLVVMPSETEGQSLVYLESQACGRVLLTSDLPAAREVVEDGSTGLLFPTGDVAELAAKTLWAAARPELRREIGRRAREQVAAHGLPATARSYALALEGLAALRLPDPGRAE